MPVSKGLFVLRYASSQAADWAPRVHLSAPSRSGIEIVSADFSETAVLGAPGHAIVVRAAQDAAIQVRIVPTREGGSRDAHLTLERIHSAGLSGFSGETIARSGARAFEPKAGAANLEFDILAHVARRGDITLHHGEWVCGPQFPMAIEGLQIVWASRPAGLDVLMSASVLSRGRKTLPSSPAGAFVGTRGKAAPLVGIALALVGPDAAGYALKCDALFLGAPIDTQSGSSIDFSGPTGLEPLVGIRVAIEPRIAAFPNETTRGQRAFPEITPSLAHATLETPSAGSNGRVRVFRTSRARPPLQQH